MTRIDEIRESVKKFSETRKEHKPEVKIIEGKKCYKHHTSLSCGYVSVKEKDGIIEPYSGRFGKGFTVKEHNEHSSKYCLITYYIEM